MKKLTLLILLLTFPLVCFIQPVFAETITFKWGDTVEAKIIERTDDHIKIEAAGTTMVYPIGDIISIDGEKIIPPPVTKDASPQGSGGTYSQKEGLFTVNIPEGWNWSELSDRVKIINPEGNSGILILFKPTIEMSLEEKKEIIKKSHETYKDIQIIKQYGKVLEEKDTQIGGVYARQLDFLFTTKDETLRTTNIMLFSKGYRFVITFGSPSEEEKSKMDEIIETLKF